MGIVMLMLIDLFVPIMVTQIKKKVGQNRKINLYLMIMSLIILKINMFP